MTAPMTRPGNSALQTNLRAALQRERRDAKEASRLAGLSESYIQNIMRGTSLNPRADTLRKIAKALNTTTAVLLGETESGDGFAVADAIGHAPITPGPKDLPIFGVRPKPAGVVAEPINEYVSRPDGLTGVKNAYASYVDGDAMAPALRHGDLVEVNPNRKLTVECEAVVTLTDGSRLMRLFISRSPKGVTVKQLNPPREDVLPTDQVKAVDRIVGRREP